MPDLRLRKLPDRTPVKVMLSLDPELSPALADYAALYSSVYGETQPVNALIPAMLVSFLEGDRAFSRHRRAGGGTAK